MLAFQDIKVPVQIYFCLINSIIDGLDFCRFSCNPVSFLATRRLVEKVNLHCLNVHFKNVFIWLSSKTECGEEVLSQGLYAF
jgi:hypothetical protein